MTEFAPTITSQIKAGDNEVTLKTPKIGASVDLGESSRASTDLAEANDRSTLNTAEGEEEDPNADIVPNSDLEDEDADDKEDEVSANSTKVIDAGSNVDDKDKIDFKGYQFRAPAISATSSRSNAGRQAEMQRLARQKEEERRRREEEERRRAARGSDASSTNSSLKSRH